MSLEHLEEKVASLIKKYAALKQSEAALILRNQNLEASLSAKDIEIETLKNQLLLKQLMDDKQDPTALKEYINQLIEDIDDTIDHL